MFSRVSSRTNVCLSPFPFSISSLLQSFALLSRIYTQTLTNHWTFVLFSIAFTYTYIKYTMTFFSFFIAPFPRHRPYSKSFAFCVKHFDEKLLGNNTIFSLWFSLGCNYCTKRSLIPIDWVTMKCILTVGCFVFGLITLTYATQVYFNPITNS